MLLLHDKIVVLLQIYHFYFLIKLAIIIFSIKNHIFRNILLLVNGALQYGSV